MSSAPASFASRRPPFEVRKVELTKLFDKLPPHALEAEAAVLGSMILDWQCVGEVLQVLKGDDFYKQAHAAIYDTLVELYDREQNIDMVLLHQRLKDKGQLEQLGGLDYLIELAEAVPSSASVAYYAKIVREKSVLRKLIEKAGTILYDCYNTSGEVGDLLDQAERAIFEIAETKMDTDASTLKALLQETFDRIEASDGKLITGVETGFYELDEMLNGMQKGEMIIVAARPSMGKAQPLDARVLTPSGWKSMGDLHIGQELASVDGSPSRVVGIYPQGVRQVYRVTFSDGRSTECCDEHLWRIHYRNWDVPRVVSTAKLRDLLTRKRYVNRVWVETFTGDFGNDASLPLDPWLLGALLGDGSLSGSAVRFSTAEPQMIEHVLQAVGPAMTISAAGGCNYRLRQTLGAHRPGVCGVSPNPVKSALQSLGLWDVNAAAKFIPDCYMTASRDGRVRLLAGLLDTDGWIERWGSIRFATCSETLAQGVVDLARSIGGSASYSRKATSYTYRGKRCRGADSFVCNIQHADAAEFFTLDPKRHRVVERQRQRRLNVVSIEPTRAARTQCIAVSHPSHLYITDDYIVTHNTAFALNIAEHIGAVGRAPVAVFSLEMSKQQLAQRLLCSRSGVDSHKLRRNMLNHDDFEKLTIAVGELSEAPIFIDDTPGLSLLALRAKARRLAARHHIQAVMVDYLQLMSAPGAESRQQEVSVLSRGIKALARELSIPVVCLSQLNRASEQREGHRPRMSDLRESGSIEQDADVVMMLHREDYYHRGEEGYEDSNVAEVIVSKQRNGPTGTVKLAFNGSTTRFNNLASGYGGGSG